MSLTKKLFQPLQSQNNGNWKKQRMSEDCGIWKAETRKWTPEQKADFNFKRSFMVDFLLRIGYSNFLNGKGGVKEWKEEFSEEKYPDDYAAMLHDHFAWVYENEKPNEFLNLHKDMVSYFQENPQDIFCDRKIYKKYLPVGNFDIVKSF